MPCVLRVRGALLVITSMLVSCFISSCIVTQSYVSPLPTPVAGDELEFSEVHSGGYALGDRNDPVVVIARETTELHDIAALLAPNDGQVVLSAFPDGISANEIVVGIFREKNGGGGYPIETYKVVADDDQVHVYSIYCHPGANDTNTRTVTHYFQVITIELNDSVQKEAAVNLIPTRNPC